MVLDNLWNRDKKLSLALSFGIVGISAILMVIAMLIDNIKNPWALRPNLVKLGENIKAW